jgi:hypothetical protein
MRAADGSWVHPDDGCPQAGDLVVVVQSYYVNEDRRFAGKLAILRAVPPDRGPWKVSSLAHPNGFFFARSVRRLTPDELAVWTLTQGTG